MAITLTHMKQIRNSAARQDHLTIAEDLESAFTPLDNSDIEIYARAKDEPEAGVIRRVAVQARRR